ncbi:DNA repair protein RecN [Eggerthellaceae bacterium zg-997]|nr:DNA repair protein RecN [Eggerthellaceae bacterium zg-997]
MIDEIRVSNLALIKSASLEPAAGLTVLTGETGAGKSALLSALKLLMGVRADKDMVREGSEGLTVEGRFVAPRCSQGEDPGAVAGGRSVDERGAVDDRCDQADDSQPFFEEGEAVVSRRVGADGRSRVSANGGMASVRQLTEHVAPLVDLCGQFEHQQLMKPATHGDLLDAWAGDEVRRLHAAYRERLAAARAAQAKLDRVREAGSASEARLDEARFVLRRIDEVSPQPGEYDQLVAELARAEHAEALARAVIEAHGALSGDDGALDQLSQAAAALEGAARFDEGLGALASSLREAGFVLEDVASETRSYRDRVEFDPAQLEEWQERVARMQGLMREFGPRMEDVLERRAQAAEQIALVDDVEERERAARAELDRAEDALAEAAEQLDRARRAAAPAFEEAVRVTMRRLEMGGSELVCAVEALDRAGWSAYGPSAVEFLYRPAAGMQARPLARIASGGEMSRVMLSVKVALGGGDAVDTLVFDEVDAGVGGAVAVALADVLADLARTHQVIVVTHLAQVAVRGQRHYRVARCDGPAGAETQLQVLDADQRVVEVARMLSGDATEASLAHAREMLQAAKDAALS